MRRLNTLFAARASRSPRDVRRIRQLHGDGKPLQRTPSVIPSDPLLLQADVLAPSLLFEPLIDLLLSLGQQHQFRRWMLLLLVHPQRLVTEQGGFIHEDGLQAWKMRAGPVQYCKSMGT